jgi:hypothetical protein
MADAFKCDGITFTENSLGNNVYGYTVKSVSLVGVTLPTTVKVAKGYTETVNATLNPASASLPTGASIKWSVPDGSSVSVTGNGMSATVKGLDWSDIDLGGANEVALTATIVDKDGNPMYQYATGSTTVKVIEKPEVSYVSDTTGNVKKAVGQTYQFKITSIDGTVPTLKVASDGATVAAYTNSGKDYFFKVTAAKVGSYGVYVNNDAKPVAVLVITSDAKIDTKTVTVKAGKTYQFKVTASAQPTFVVANIGTVKATSTKGNDYFYKVTATNKAGSNGVYVNGARVAIIAFA